MVAVSIDKLKDLPDTGADRSTSKEDLHDAVRQADLRGESLTNFVEQAKERGRETIRYLCDSARSLGRGTAESLLIGLGAFGIGKDRTVGAIRSGIDIASDAIDTATEKIAAAPSRALKMTEEGYKKILNNTKEFFSSIRQGLIDEWNAMQDRRTEKFINNTRNESTSAIRDMRRDIYEARGLGESYKRAASVWIKSELDGLREIYESSRNGSLSEKLNAELAFEVGIQAIKRGLPAVIRNLRADQKNDKMIASYRAKIEKLENQKNARSLAKKNKLEPVEDATETNVAESHAEINAFDQEDTLELTSDTENQAVAPDPLDEELKYLDFL